MTLPSDLLNVTVMSLEVFALSRGKLLPDPIHDQVHGVFYAVKAQEGPDTVTKRATGVILQGVTAVSSDNLRFSRDAELTLEFVADERELFHRVEALVYEWDPDFLAGFEIQKGSLGYLVDRASQLDVSLPSVCACCCSATY